MQPTQLKKMSINVMIGSLIGSALLAVVAVLVGHFDETFSKALFTLLIVTLHALVCLGFMESRIKTPDNDELKVFTNTIFTLIVLSFVTSIFGIWGFLEGEWVAKLYGTYFVVAFAALHGEMLYKTRGLDNTINNIVMGNYVFMLAVIVLLLPIIWAGDAEFPDFYYRLLAAVAIIDATLTILAVILHKLYLQKHPEAKSEIFSQVVYTLDAQGNQVPTTLPPVKRRMHPLLVILILFIILQFVAPILFFVIGSAFWD